MTPENNVSKIYRELFEESVSAIAEGKVITDPLIDDPNDDRRGITVLARPSRSVCEKIAVFQNALSRTDQHQYAQPSSDLHLTVLSLISCYTGFSLNDITVPDYVKIIADSLGDIGPFTVRFRGITASKDAVLIQGFPEDDTLETVRDRIRTNLKKSTLQHTLDSRYTIRTAHLTAVRFRHPLCAPAEYVALLHEFRDFDFGDTTDALELVFNDWYQKKDLVKTLRLFPLPTLTVR